MRRGLVAVLTVGTLALVGVAASLALRDAGSGAAQTPAVQVPPPTFEVAIRAEPATAQLRLDGSNVVIGSLRASLPRDGRQHTLTVRAEGYEPETLNFIDVPPSERVALRRVTPALVPSPSVPVLRPTVVAAVPAPQPTRHATPEPTRVVRSPRTRERGVETSPMIHAPLPQDARSAQSVGQGIPENPFTE